MYSLTILLPLLFPAVQAHMALWHPAALDFNGDGYEASVPLSGESFSTWWFHGALDKASSVTEKLSLPAGESVTVELACNKRFTSYGTDAVDNESCPDDVASNHAGSPINQSELRGCALAIAYKSDFADVNPDDFAVFSVNTQCVQNKDTSFEVPAVMPVCPSGGCICAWFWQGQESDDEMVRIPTPACEHSLTMYTVHDWFPLQR